MSYGPTLSSRVTRAGEPAYGWSYFGAPRSKRLWGRLPLEAIEGHDAPRAWDVIDEGLGQVPTKLQLLKSGQMRIELPGTGKALPYVSTNGGVMIQLPPQAYTGTGGYGSQPGGGSGVSTIGVEGESGEEIGSFLPWIIGAAAVLLLIKRR